MIEWTPEELQKNLESGQTVFLKLWKNGCGACKLSESATRRLEDEFQGKLTFASISTDDHPEIMEIAEVDVVPAFFVFKDRDMKSKVVGFKGIEKLKTMINEAVG
jgi:thioredoxin-like negative regulator of GroEL